MNSPFLDREELVVSFLRVRVCLICEKLLEQRGEQCHKNRVTLLPECAHVETENTVQPSSISYKLKLNIVKMNHSDKYVIFFSSATNYFLLKFREREYSDHPTNIKRNLFWEDLKQHFSKFEE